VLIVSKMLEKHFGFIGYYRLNIHGIDVDTQQDDAIEVIIKLRRPGLLIGKGGKDIDAVNSMLERYFCKIVHINIVEIKNDVNVPYSDY
jgi:ribosomal protein S3